MPLRRRLVEPLPRLFQVLLDALAIRIQYAKIILRFGEALSAALRKQDAAFFMSFGTPCPTAYNNPMLFCAGATPLAAAFSSHFADSLMSFGTPRPVK